MESLAIVGAVYGFPLALAGILYALEGTSHTIKRFRQRRAINRRLDGLR